ncbi:methyl-accepting chemotaxis protein [Acidithrix sp. C25]|nr:methyl-accepting chemotaxis protein [Acidithrix sp. C25]
MLTRGMHKATTSRSNFGTFNVESTEVVVARMVASASSLGIDVVDIWGMLDSLATKLEEQAKYFQEMGGVARDVVSSNEKVAQLAQSTQVVAQDVDSLLESSRGTVGSSLSEIRTLASWVSSTSDELVELGVELQSVAGVASQIDKIAQQTHILALNARIEAVRSGKHGTSFAVIANSIRDLADQTISMAASIGDKLAGLTDRVGSLEASAQKARQGASATEAGTNQIAEVISGVSVAVAKVDGDVSEMANAAQESSGQMTSFNNSLAMLIEGVDSSSKELGLAKTKSSDLLDSVEVLLQTANTSDVETIDTSFINLAINTAAEFSRLLENALSSGKISESELFDSDYVPVSGSNPIQHLTKFVRLSDELFVSAQEKALEMDERVVFCVAVDRNGYLPTHNLKFSKPQGPDPIWNAANCRNRRIFADRTGLAAGRNQEHVLLQTYRRDMGGGKYALMKDVSSPIWVNGAHWGGVRVAYLA